MKNCLVAIGVLSLLAAALQAEVTAGQSGSGWFLRNGKVALELRTGADGQPRVASLKAGGREWVAADSPVSFFLEVGSGATSSAKAGFRFQGADVTSGNAGSRGLTLRFANPSNGAHLSLAVRAFPDLGVLEYRAVMENRGSSTLPLIYRMDPLNLEIGNGVTRILTPAKNAHGFRQQHATAGQQNFQDWVTIQAADERATLMIGGDTGSGMLRWNVDTDESGGSLHVRAGLSLPAAQGSSQRQAYEIRPGERVELPLVFVAAAAGDADEAANQAFRYLRRCVFPPPVDNTPLATYCIWLTDPDSEAIVREELVLARRMGFDVFYHDASWFEGSSEVPGMNDWSMGLGSYQESRRKFPSGLRSLSDAVRSAGMKFGIWVDPGNVDSARVASGEVPAEWVATHNGVPLQTRHPSLSPITQLCFGDPKVVEWVKQNLASIIDRWNLEWLKWDPSGTVSYACDRGDHGHTRNNGLYAAYRGRMEILAYLMKRFPSLSGFECDPSLEYSRTNPGPKELLPGGYTNEFITGPMVSPNVWGSLASAGNGDAFAAQLTAGWYSASALDYHLRKHFLHGVTFGNINGMASQRLSEAPAGYREAFKRNLLHFKQYRHLLLEDVYHPKLATPEGWSVLQYAKADASEALLFAFRDPGGAARNSVRLRGLDAGATYHVRSLNDRPGRDRMLGGRELMERGVELTLPDLWLAKGDGLAPRFEAQLRFGSDILVLRRAR